VLQPRGDRGLALEPGAERAFERFLERDLAAEPAIGDPGDPAHASGGKDLACPKHDRATASRHRSRAPSVRIETHIISP